MKRTLLGIGFSLTGAIMNGFIMLTAVLYATGINTGPSFLPLWNAIFSSPRNSDITSLHLGIPYILSMALILLGLVLLFIELFRRNRSSDT